jgi:hypothetical protein
VPTPCCPGSSTGTSSSRFLLPVLNLSLKFRPDCSAASTCVLSVCRQHGRHGGVEQLCWWWCGGAAAAAPARTHTCHMVLMRQPTDPECLLCCHTSSSLVLIASAGASSASPAPWKLKPRHVSISVMVLLAYDSESSRPVTSCAGTVGVA